MNKLSIIIIIIIILFFIASLLNIRTLFISNFTNPKSQKLPARKPPTYVRRDIVNKKLMLVNKNPCPGKTTFDNCMKKYNNYYKCKNCSHYNSYGQCISDGMKTPAECEKCLNY
jgi:hypothetical protein